MSTIGPSWELFRWTNYELQWRQKALPWVREASSRLRKQKGKAGQVYLQSRGISTDTWHDLGLGFHPAIPLPATFDERTKTYTYPPQPAIVIPSFEAGNLIALRYHFLKPHTYRDIYGQGRKNVRERDGKNWSSTFPESVFFDAVGLVDWLPKTPKESLCLLICQDVIDAISAWQESSGIDIVSVSASAVLSPTSVATAMQYRRVLIWTRKEAAQALMSQLPDAIYVKSPNGEDANTMLLRGELSPFLKSCRDDIDFTSFMEKRRALAEFFDSAEHRSIKFSEISASLGISEEDILRIMERDGLAGWHLAARPPRSADKEQ